MSTTLVGVALTAAGGALLATMAARNIQNTYSYNGSSTFNDEYASVWFARSAIRNVDTSDGHVSHDKWAIQRPYPHEGYHNHPRYHPYFIAG
jgi:hypothetical protein